jgi:hypothetical protein
VLSFLLSALLLSPRIVSARILWMEERALRVAENEVLFREINDDVIHVEHAMFEILCECGALSCMQRVAVAQEHYAQARLEDTDFLVIPGHEDPEVEFVVDRAPGVLVVRKIGVGAVVARDARRK